MLITILATAVVLGVLIFTHELGHFLTAKWADIEVPRFSIGLGPKLLGFRRGETEYVISALPLGGFVKMAGMQEMESIEGGDDRPAGEPRTAGPRDFESKSLGTRVLVISAGVIMNTLFAFVAFASIAMVWGVSANPETIVGNVVEHRLPPGAEALAVLERGSRITSVGSVDVDNFEDLQLQIAAARPGPIEIGVDGRAPVSIVLPESDSLRTLLALAVEPVSGADARLSGIVADGPAAAAGLEPGDVITAAGGTAVATWQEFIHVVETNPGRPVALVIDRDGESLDFTVVPRADTVQTGIVVGRLGVTRDASEMLGPRDRLEPIAAVGYGAAETWRWTRLTVEFLGGLVTGRYSAREMGGPIMIGQLSGQVARSGLQDLLKFMALLSVNLAVLNLLPIPALDGGHLLFMLIEGVRGRAISLQQRMRLTQAGVVLIFGLILFALGNDVLRLFGL